MATHCSILAWNISWIEESGGLQSKGSQNWTQLKTCTHAHTHMHTHNMHTYIYIYITHKKTQMEIYINIPRSGYISTEIVGDSNFLLFTYHSFLSYIQIYVLLYIYSVMSDSLRPHGLYSPWNSPCHNTGVGSLSLLQGIFRRHMIAKGIIAGDQ